MSAADTAGDAAAADAALPDITTDGGWKRGNEDDVSVIRDCYCPSCGGGNAVTTVLPTEVPLFREVVLMNVACRDCGFRNAAANFGGEIQPAGERLVLRVVGPADLNRQVIKSDSATVTVPAVDLEIPPAAQRGTVSTVEGILLRAADNLAAHQPDRLKLGDVENFRRCQSVIDGLRRLACCKNGGGDCDDDEEEADDDGNGNDENKNPASSVFPFEIILDDPAGNSFIENPAAPAPDPNLQSTKYNRTPTQDMELGLQPSKQAVADGVIDDADPRHKNAANESAAGAIETTTTTKTTKSASAPGRSGALGREEVMKFPTTCPNCHRAAETDMCVTDVPHFKEVIIMSMVCEHCGYRSNEIKGGGAIPAYGTEIVVTVSRHEDLAREVLKSDTAGIAVPEIDLHLAEGGLDGVYTTIEGLLLKMHESLGRANPFGTGDSAQQHHLTNDGGQFSGPSDGHRQYLSLLKKLKDMAAGNILPFTVRISDPLSNSFVGPVPKDAVALSLQAERDGTRQCYDEYVDPRMQIREYDRTHEQNEILGLNDIKTENYQQQQQSSLGGDNENNNNGGGSATSAAAEEREYYGTDACTELPDRITRLDVRGPDHPHAVAKAPVEGDTTVMGPGSLSFSVPAMGQRGQRSAAAAAATTTTTTTTTGVETTETTKTNNNGA